MPGLVPPVVDEQEALLAHQRVGPDETPVGLLERYAAVARQTRATVVSIADLGQAVPVPPGVPWFPADFGVIRSAVSAESDQAFRSNPITEIG